MNSYSATVLIALLVHSIVNFSVLRNHHYRKEFPAGRTYRHLQLGIMSFYGADILWGSFYERHLISAVYADTVAYFAAMTAIVFLWARYVIAYLKEDGILIRIFSHTAWVYVFFTTGALLVNFFTPVLFWIDRDCVYHASDLRYAMLAMQIVMFVFSSCYVMITARGRPTSDVRHHWAIGSFGIIMTAMVFLQVAYPLQPMYTIGCLLGSCILHVFVLEDQNEDRRLELEKLLEKEARHQRELGFAMKLAYTDSLTGVKSSHAYIEAVKHLDEKIDHGELRDFAVVVFDVNGLKHVNDTQGHEAGDRHIRSASKLICSRFKNCPVFRIGGDEFVSFLEGDSFASRQSLMTEFEAAVENNLHSGAVTIASGLAEFQPGQDSSYRKLFEKADSKMYQRKGSLKAMAA